MKAGGRRLEVEGRRQEDRIWRLEVGGRRRGPEHYYHTWRGCYAKMLLNILVTATYIFMKIAFSMCRVVLLYL